MRYRLIALNRNESNSIELRCGATGCMTIEHSYNSPRASFSIAADKTNSCERIQRLKKE